MQTLKEEMRREKELFVTDKQSLSDLLVRAHDSHLCAQFGHLLFCAFVSVT